MPVVLTIVVSRLEFSWRAARLHTIARRFGNDHSARQGWQSPFGTAESQSGEGKEFEFQDRQEASFEDIHSITLLDSDSDDESQLLHKIPMRAMEEQRDKSEVEAGELGRENTRVASQSGHQRDSTLRLPELRLMSIGTPSVAAEPISVWSPDTPVKRWNGFKWPIVGQLRASEFIYQPTKLFQSRS